ncbi:MAG: hypothetical protein Ct9H90mP8_2470 [Pseudomonadota bacterium]|nr:MAG: hypothetical protein Ct9H90mP8_2470 [Pseudomonadota bacterium]
MNREMMPIVYSFGVLEKLLAFIGRKDIEASLYLATVLRATLIPLRR